MDGLKEFATQFLNGELTAYVKSEPVPENNDGPVKVGDIMLLSMMGSLLKFTQKILYTRKSSHVKES